MTQIIDHSLNQTPSDIGKNVKNIAVKIVIYVIVNYLHVCELTISLVLCNAARNDVRPTQLHSITTIIKWVRACHILQYIRICMANKILAKSIIQHK